MKSIWRMSLVVAVLVTVMGASSTSLWAQSSSTGALKGTVTDQSGAVVPNATITLTSTATGQVRTTTSADNGAYSFSLLPPAAYSVSVAAGGFKTLEVPSVTVNVTETHGLDVKLEIGSQQQMVSVNATVDTIQTESATLGGVVGEVSINTIPLVTRNYTQILSLSPGVVSDVNDATTIGRGTQFVYVNGSTNAGTTYQMDGMSVNNYPSSGPKDIGNGFFGYLPIPSPDALQEFKVQTSGYDSSFGRNSGANVNVVTKSGTNNLHGTMFEFFRNNALNANSFFRNATGQKRGILKQNQFGGTVGGPIKKDKLFFFFSYQGTRQRNGIASPDASSSVLLPAKLTNDRTRAGLGAAFCPANNPVAKTLTYSLDPNVPNPASDQVDCLGNNISQVAINILNAKLPNGDLVIPTPQTIRNPGTAGAVGFSTFSSPAKFTEDQVLFNLDYVITPKHSLALKYFYAYAPTISPFSAASQPPNGGARGVSGNQLFAGKLTSLLSNNLVNEAHLSSYYIRATVASLVTTTAASVGMTPSHPSSPLIPAITVTGLFGSFGSAVDGGESPSKNYEWSDQLSWIHKSHTFRMGFDQQYIDWYLCSCGKARGTLTFNTFSDFLLGMSAAQNGSTLSNVFQSNTSIQLWSSPNKIRENQLSTFIQDDWKVSPRLTLNLGLRWEYDGSAYDTNPVGGTNMSWPDVLAVPVPPVTGTFVGFNVAKDYTGPVPPGVTRRNTQLLTANHAPLDNFSPRVGFAWQPFSSSARFVVRGGYGWFYEVIQGNAWDQTFIYTPPNNANLNYVGTSNALATLADPYNPKVAPGSFDTMLRTQSSQLSYRGTDPHTLTPLTMAWNLNTQYAITSSLTFDLGYVGSRAVHIVTPQLFNIPQLATAGNPVNCTYPSGCITTNDGNPSLRVPVLGLAPAGFQLTTNGGDSNYNGLQATLRKNFSHGLQFQAAYTYGRNFSDVSGINFIGGVGGNTKSNDPTDHRQMYAPTDFHRPQRLVISYFYNLPGFRNSDGMTGKLLSGWTFSGVTTVQSGLPITITDTRGGAVYGFAGASRAQLCDGKTYADVPTSGSVKSRLNGYFNASAFCTVPKIGKVGAVDGATGYGNTARNFMSGPGQFNWDMAISKKTTVGGLREDAFLEFRSEFFNIFNHAQFSNPATNFASGGSFGKITTTSTSPRTIQFALRYAF